jgi:hypothetical protein
MRIEIKGLEIHGNNAIAGKIKLMSLRWPAKVRDNLRLNVFSEKEEQMFEGKPEIVFSDLAEGEKYFVEKLSKDLKRLCGSGVLVHTA